jgi:hypothetical protein
MSFTKRRINMKTRLIPAILIATALVVWGLASCSQNPVVSIDQRISNFASDLNNNRSGAYQDFDPDQTKEYQELANPTYAFDTLFPAGSPPYAFQVTDESSPSSGVFVTVTSSPPAYGSQFYLKLVMATYQNTDWRIVQLFMSSTVGSFSNPIID